MVRLRILLITFTVFCCCNATGQFDDKSELARLMVKMLQHLKTEKVNVVRNKKPQSFPESFSSIHTAAPTVGKNLDPNHKELSDNFLQLLRNYHENGQIEKRKPMFNALVKSCISCHEKVCPGPIAAIEKNLLQ